MVRVCKAVMKTAASFRQFGLRCVEDHDLDRVLADCPACHGADRDPQGMYLPLTVWFGDGRTTMACGYDCTNEEIASAFRALIQASS